MPIRPSERALYPKGWAALSERIRRDRAGGRCECRGACGDSHGGDRCQRFQGQRLPAGGRVVLTVAHLDHDPRHNDERNLLAMCQRCHLALDRDEHRHSAGETRAEKGRAESGQIPMFGRTEYRDAVATARRVRRSLDATLDLERRAQDARAVALLTKGGWSGESERLRDEAIARVEAASAEWQESAARVVRSLAATRAHLTTDDLWACPDLPRPREPRAMGAAMVRAARDGVLRRTDRSAESVRPECHRRFVRVWESLAFPSSVVETFKCIVEGEP